MFYLGSRAMITAWLWGRYSGKLASFMDCSACSGTWYGALVGYVGGYHLGLSFLGLPGDRPYTVAAVALCSMTTTPIVAGLVQKAIEALGTAIEVTPEPMSEPEPEALPPLPHNELRRTVSGTITPPEVPLTRRAQTKDPNGGSGPR
jgi:hypothetical protein